MKSAENNNKISKQKGRPRIHEKPLVTVTYRMKEEQKRKLKVYAATQGKTVSQVVAEFVDSLDVKI